MMNVIVLNVFMLNIIMLSVGAPGAQIQGPLWIRSVRSM